MNYYGSSIHHNIILRVFLLYIVLIEAQIFKDMLYVADALGIMFYDMLYPPP